MSAGPNLLAWAKDNSVIAPELFCVSHALSALARAILADEEERKRRLESADFASVGTVDARPEWREQWFNGERHEFSPNHDYAPDGSVAGRQGAPPSARDDG